MLMIYRRVVSRFVAEAQGKAVAFYRRAKYRHTRDIIRHPAIRIGEFTYGEPLVLFADDGALLKVGRFCSIAQEVKIFLGGNHHIDRVSSYPFSIEQDIFNGASATSDRCTKGDVNIGNDVWIGRGVSILSGITIGDGAVVGACSVVTKDVPPYGVAVGNPARVIKYRFTAEVIAGLRMIRWWDWDTEDINRKVASIQSAEVEKFVEGELGLGWRALVQTVRD
jgi:acetyltransferase-like isoleucine patch superfamily enzyme